MISPVLSEWAVITKADETDGNLADDFVAPGNLADVVPGALIAGKLRVKTRVFHVGELLLLNEYGREIGYPGRKPSKWQVDYETWPLAEVDQAVQRAREVTDAWMQNQ